MKTIIKSIACALALTTSVAFAHPTDEKTSKNEAPIFESSMFVTADANLRVAVKKNTHQKVHLTLKDSNGALIYTTTIGKNEMKYAAKINVSELADGAYQLEIASGNNRVVRNVNLSSKKVEFQRNVTVE